MVLAIDQYHGAVRQFVASEDAASRGFEHAFLDCRDVLPRYRTADNLLLELQPGAAFQRFHLEVDAGVLPVSASLFLVRVIRLGAFCNGLAVLNAGQRQLDIDVELSPEPLDGDVEVGIPEPREHDLARDVAAEPESWVLFQQALEAWAELVHGCLRSWMDGHAVHGVREGDLGQRDDVFFGAEGVGGLRVRELRHHADVPRAQLRDGLLLLASLDVDRAQALIDVLVGVPEVAVRFHRAGDYPQVSEAPNVRVGGGLEHEDDGRRRRVGEEIFVAGVDRLAVEGRRTTEGDIVEQLADANLLCRRGAGNGDDQPMIEAAVEYFAQFVFAQLLIGEILRHQRFIGLDDALDQFSAELLGFGHHLGWDVDLVAVFSEVGLHVKEVDHTLERIVGADR